MKESSCGEAEEASSEDGNSRTPCPSFPVQGGRSPPVEYTLSKEKQKFFRCSLVYRRQSQRFKKELQDREREREREAVPISPVTPLTSFPVHVPPVPPACPDRDLPFASLARSPGPWGFAAAALSSDNIFSVKEPLKVDDPTEISIFPTVKESRVNSSIGSSTENRNSAFLIMNSNPFESPKRNTESRSDIGTSPTRSTPDFGPKSFRCRSEGILTDRVNRFENRTKILSNFKSPSKGIVSESASDESPSEGLSVEKSFESGLFNKNHNGSDIEESFPSRDDFDRNSLKGSLFLKGGVPEKSSGKTKRSFSLGGRRCIAGDVSKNLSNRSLKYTKFSTRDRSVEISSESGRSDSDWSVHDRALSDRHISSDKKSSLDVYEFDDSVESEPKTLRDLAGFRRKSLSEIKNNDKLSCLVSRGRRRTRHKTPTTGSEDKPETLSPSCLVKSAVNNKSHDYMVRKSGPTGSRSLDLAQSGWLHPATRPTLSGKNYRKAKEHVYTCSGPLFPTFCT